MRPTGQGGVAIPLALVVLLGGIAVAQIPSPEPLGPPAYPADPSFPAVGPGTETVPPGTPSPSPAISDQSISGLLGPSPAFGPPPSPAGAAPCPGPCADYDGYWCPPRWYLGAGAHILGRTRAHQISLSRDLATHETLMTTQSDSFDGAPGGYVTLGRYLGLDSSNRNHYLEFQGWMAGTWESDDVVTTDGRVNITNPARNVGRLESFFQTPLSGFSGADAQSYDYDSRLLNFELNYWIRPRGRPDRLVLYPNGKWYRERNQDLLCSFMFGVRGMSLDEDFTFNSWSHVVTGDDSVDAEGRYRIETDNGLIGFQVGGDIVQHGRRWEAGIQAKAAPMVNFSSQGSRLLAVGDTGFAEVDRAWSDDTGGVAFLGEFGARGKYWLTPSAAVFCAYNLYWLFGVTLAPEQITFSDYPAGEIRDEATVFMHGLSLGFEVSY